MSRKILCDLCDTCVTMSAKYFQLKTLKTMEILSGERSQKNVKAKVKRAPFWGSGIPLLENQVKKPSNGL